jgi:hypothetical protein
MSSFQPKVHLMDPSRAVQGVVFLVCGEGAASMALLVLAHEHLLQLSIVRSAHSASFSFLGNWSLARGAVLTENLWKACHDGHVLDSSTEPFSQSTELSLCWQVGCLEGSASLEPYLLRGAHSTVP